MIKLIKLILLVQIRLLKVMRKLRQISILGYRYTDVSHLIFFNKYCISVLQPLTGESFVKKSTITDDEARVDVSARGFWVRGQRAFLDIRAFSPLAKSHVNKDLQAVYRSQEKEKKRKYNNRNTTTEKLIWVHLRL